MKDKTLLTAIAASFVIILCSLYLNFYPGPKPLNKAIFQTQPEVTLSPSSTSAPAKPQTTSLDAAWNLFTDPVNKFSLKFPKSALVAWGNCHYDNGQYSMKEEFVPLTVLSTSAGGYLVQQYFYDPTVANNNGTIKYTACTKTATTYALVQNRIRQAQINPTQPNIHPDGYDIKVQTVADDNELLAFIKSVYGSGCRLGQKTPVNATTYNVKVENDGLDLDKTQCPINYLIAFKYSPQLHLAATWAMGQYPYFSSSDPSQNYTSIIEQSFTFLP